jgi:hypothetical protein
MIRLIEIRNIFIEHYVFLEKNFVGYAYVWPNGLLRKKHYTDPWDLMRLHVRMITVLILSFPWIALTLVFIESIELIWFALGFLACFIFLSNFLIDFADHSIQYFGDKKRDHAKYKYVTLSRLSITMFLLIACLMILVLFGTLIYCMK